MLGLAGRKKKAAPAAPKQEEPTVQYPCTVVVNKGTEKIPVQVKDAAHRARLVDEFGEKALEVHP